MFFLRTRSRGDVKIDLWSLDKDEKGEGGDNSSK